MLTMVAVALLALSPPASTAMSANCDLAVLQTTGSCPIYSTGADAISISSTQQRPGTPAIPNTPGAPPSSRSDTAPLDPAKPTPARPSERAIQLAACLDDGGTVRCSTFTASEVAEPTPNAPGDPAPPAPTITITDLARFAPPPVSAKAEPGNVGIADLPTNFTTTATTHTQAGELFGIPLTVRFTPATYAYDYGDGTTATLTAPGQTWEALGLPQFSPTATTHVYRERGEYSVILITGYTVEIDLGTGWIPLAGQITTTGTPQTIRILEARTALVAHTCTEDPDGIGC